MSEEENQTKEIELQPETHPALIQKASDEDMQKLQSEYNELKDKYFRVLADQENVRKRMQREKIESQSYALQNITCDLLQPLDHFEQAIKHLEAAPKEVQQWAKGFEMILTQFIQALGDHGISTFTSKGEQFDPHSHEAIETEETDKVAPGTILEEFVKGYKLGQRVIRPAKVKVACASQSQ